MSSVGDKKEFSCLICDSIVDLHTIATTQCFPLYYYEGNPEKTQMSIFGDNLKDTYIRKDGISDWIVKRAAQQYRIPVQKEDIFYYVYGFLHSPAYRQAFSNDLKKSLPRIPLVENIEDFWKFSKAGRELAALHLNYESVPPLDSVVVKGDRSKCRVQKMRFLAKDRKDTIIFNENIRIENIPAVAYEYVVNGRSAIEWVMERYQYTVDKASGIVNDPNMYATEIGKPTYILDLLLSVISVSVKTIEIVRKLPKVEW